MRVVWSAKAIVRLVLSWSCLLASCGGGEQGGESQKNCASGCAGAPSQPITGDAGAPSEPITGDAADFCQRFVDEYAEYMEGCGCSAASAERYRQEAYVCQPDGFFESVTAAVAAGDLIYDPSAADALFARYDEPEQLCVEEPFRALGLDSSELYSFAGTFTGTRALGSACTMPVSYKGGISDCREGVCAGTEPGSGVCVALVGEGEECDASGDDNLDGASARVCFEERVADIDGEYESAFDSLSCVPLGSGASTRICARDLAVGEECQSNAACASGLCESVGVDQFACAALRGDGETCESMRQCLSGSCLPGPEPRVCGAPLADGQACDYADSACASGNCTGESNGGSCVPAASRAVGEPCTTSDQCITLGNGNPALCHEGVCVADVCTSYLD